MSEEKNEKLSIFQILLLVILYGGIITSIVLSIIATKDVGREGYEKCMDEWCAKGEQYCT